MGMMHTRTASRGAIFATLLVLLAAFSIACGPKEKSQALADLERQLQDPSANEVKDAPGASKPYREARQYRRLSLESWGEGKEELSQEYAVLGMLRYRTAAAISEQHEAKARLEEANAKVDESNPEIKALNQEQIKLAEEVNQLELTVAQARRRKEEADRRADAMASQQVNGTNSNDGALRTQLQNKLNEVTAAKLEADAVNASTHAPQKYNPAMNLLKSVRALQSSGTINQQVITDASTALRLFKEAEQAAQASYQEELAKQNPAMRRQNLVTDATANFGAPYVITEPTGARVVLAGAFAKGATYVSASHDGVLKSLVEIAKKYDEFSIYIHGYTSKGDATENLGISQLRARTIKDYLTANGVKASRIETKGHGQDARRYPSDPSQNDRAEVVFSR